jgi:3',5'-cyclic AMP phosphodiesterase CpdA
MSAVVQISDLHVVPDGSLAHGALDTVRLFRALAAHLASLGSSIDAVVMTGDLADDGQIESYEILAEAVAAIAPPVFCLPGNHDDPEALREILGDRLPGGSFGISGPGLCGTVDLPGGRLVLADSTVSGRHGGGLSPPRLEWLEAALAGGNGAPALVMMHHPPFASGLALMDEPFEGAGELAAIMARHPSALLGCGHLHLPMATRWAGGAAVVCPSALSMVPEFSPRGGGEFTLGPPAYLLHRLGGGVSTHFCSLPGMWPTGGPFVFFDPPSPRPPRQPRAAPADQRSF